MMRLQIVKSSRPRSVGEPSGCHHGPAGRSRSDAAPLAADDQGLDPGRARLGTPAHLAPAGASCCQSRYLIQMLGSALTCANGCSCWSPYEENSPQFFLTMDVFCRPARGTSYRSAARHRHCINADEETDKSSTHRHIAPTMLPDHCGINSANALLTSYPVPSTAHAIRCFTPPASRPDRAATQALRLGTRWHQLAGVSPEREPHSSSHSRLTPRAYPQHSSAGARDDVRGRRGRSRARSWPRWESPSSSARSSRRPTRSRR
jgi:hypothetical protein